MDRQIYMLLSLSKINGIFSSRELADNYIYKLWKIENEKRFSGKDEYKHFYKKFEIVETVLNPVN